MTWELKHSVIANADRETVWKFISNIENMARIEGDAVESLTLDGPYETGSSGTTKMKGQEPIRWTLVDVKPPERAVTQMQLAGAVVRFAWTYDELPGGGTRMTQQIRLEGPGAAVYLPLMEQHFAPNVAAGRKAREGYWQVSRVQVDPAAQGN